MSPIKPKPSHSWIIGYGNIQRRDDGIGPYVVNKLYKFLKYRRDLHILSLHQLEPDLIHDLRHAHLILFVDATMNELEEGWNLVRIKPECKILPYLTHYFEPSFLLILLQSVYHQYPPTWLASVQGNDFGFGEGLTQEAEERANHVILEIKRFISMKMVDKTETSSKVFRKQE